MTKKKTISKAATKKPTKSTTKKPAAKQSARKKPVQRTRRKQHPKKSAGLFQKVKQYAPSWRAVAIVSLLIGLTVLWIKDIPQYYFYELTADSGLTVKTIEIAGRRFADKEQVRAALNIMEGESMARFDPKQAHQNLMDVRWVDKVHVQRRWPDSIIVKIRERSPIAIITGAKHKDYLVDRQGRSLGP